MKRSNTFHRGLGWHQIFDILRNESITWSKMHPILGEAARGCFPHKARCRVTFSLAPGHLQNVPKSRGYQGAYHGPRYGMISPAYLGHWASSGCRWPLYAANCCGPQWLKRALPGTNEQETEFHFMILDVIWCDACDMLNCETLIPEVDSSMDSSMVIPQHFVPSPPCTPCTQQSTVLRRKPWLWLWKALSGDGLGTSWNNSNTLQLVLVE